MLSFSLLNKIQQGVVDALKASKVLCRKDSFSRKCILVVDEMYLQKSTQYQSGEYVWEDEEGNLYKGIAARMIVELKQFITFAIQAIPEIIRFNGQWQAKKISDNIDILKEIGLYVWGIVTNNYSANVNAFSTLIKIFNSEWNYYIKHLQNSLLFYDTVHLMKSIRNNLVNRKKFAFPEFVYDDNLQVKIICQEGFIRWGDL